MTGIRRSAHRERWRCVRDTFWPNGRGPIVVESREKEPVPRGECHRRLRTVTRLSSTAGRSFACADPALPPARLDPWSRRSAHSPATTERAVPSSQTIFPDYCSQERRAAVLVPLEIRRASPARDETRLDDPFLAKRSALPPVSAASSRLRRQRASGLRPTRSSETAGLQTSAACWRARLNPQRELYPPCATG